MKIKQKLRRSFALIGVMLLCILTMIVPISADSYELSWPTSDPIRSLYHIEITTSTEGMFILGPDFTYDESGDLEWGIPRLLNAVIVLSRSGDHDGSRVWIQCEQFTASTWFDGDAYAGISIAACCYDLPGEVVYIEYDPYGVTQISSGLMGEYYDKVEIYVRPQYSYSAYPEPVTPTAEELETYSVLTQWGFSTSIAPYPSRQSSSDTAYDQGYDAGRDREQLRY